MIRPQPSASVEPPPHTPLPQAEPLLQEHVPVPQPVLHEKLEPQFDVVPLCRQRNEPYCAHDVGLAAAQWNPSVAPAPVQAPAVHPAQLTHFWPSEH